MLQVGGRAGLGQMSSGPSRLARQIQETRPIVLLLPEILGDLHRGTAATQQGHSVALLPRLQSPPSCPLRRDEATACSGVPRCLAGVLHQVASQLKISQSDGGSGAE